MSVSLYPGPCIPVLLSCIGSNFLIIYLKCIVAVYTITCSPVMGSPYHTVTVSPGQPAIWSTAGPASSVSSCTRRLRNRDFTLATAHPVHGVTRTQGNTVTLSLGRRSVKRTPYHSHAVTRSAWYSVKRNLVTRAPCRAVGRSTCQRVHPVSQSFRHPVTRPPCQSVTGHTVTTPRIKLSFGNC